MILRRFYWGIATIIIVLTLVLVVAIVNSFWFFQALLPLEDVGYSIGYRNGFVESSSLAKTIREKNHSLIPDIAQSYSRFLYKKEGEKEYFVGVPKLSRQFSVEREMEDKQWRTKRWGWIVIGGRSDSLPNATIFSATKASLKMIILQRLPLNAIGIAQVKPEDGEGFSIYLESNRKGLHAVLNTKSILFVRGVSYRLGKEIIPHDMTYVSIQREELSYLPKGFLNAMEDKVSEMLHFTNTHPKIFEDFGSLGSIAVAVKNDSVAIGVLSQDSAASSTINSWINNEQGTRHPKKKAFLLPDRSLGYEYVPGEANAYFNLNREKNSCFVSENYDEDLLLCGKDKMVVLANGDEIGNQLITLSEVSEVFTRGIVQGPLMTSLGINDQFQKIEYRKHNELVEVWADKQ